jgi:LemA protein
MKKPLLSLVIFSTIFFGIILFSVIFGGYSSLYRAQNRVRDAKLLVTVECQKQLDLLPGLISMARKTDDFNPIGPNQADLKQIEQTALKHKAILTQIISQKQPMEKELVLTFEQSQIQLSREIIGLINQIKKDKGLGSSPAFIDLEKKFNDLEITVFYNGTKYNKEAIYFNTRKSIFPGFLIARLFGFDQIFIYELTTERFKPAKLRS